MQMKELAPLSSTEKTELCLITLTDEILLLLVWSLKTNKEELNMQDKGPHLLLLTCPTQ